MAGNNKQYLPKGAMMGAPAKSPVADWLPRNNDAYRQIYNDVTYGGPLDKAPGALSLTAEPFEQVGDYLGDLAFDVTGSPFWGTAAYMIPHTAAMPMSTVAKVGKDIGKLATKPIAKMTKSLEEYMSENQSILQRLRDAVPQP